MNRSQELVGQTAQLSQWGPASLKTCAHPCMCGPMHSHMNMYTHRCSNISLCENAPWRDVCTAHFSLEEETIHMCMNRKRQPWLSRGGRCEQVEVVTSHFLKRYLDLLLKFFFFNVFKIFIFIRGKPVTMHLRGFSHKWEITWNRGCSRKEDGACPMMHSEGTGRSMLRANGSPHRYRCPLPASTRLQDSDSHSGRLHQ